MAENRPQPCDPRMRLDELCCCAMSEVERWLEMGNGYVHESRYAEALPWLEGAVAVAERADVSGREYLFRALEAVGFCYFRLDRLAEAVRWYERAVAAAGDGADLRACFDILARCYSGLARYAEALPWYERAVTAKQNGNVAPGELGKCLHDAGDCCLNLDRDAEALQWFERAVAAKQRPDAHGHVDTRSVELSLRQVAHCRARVSQIADPAAHGPAQPARTGPAGRLGWLEAVAAPFPVEWRQILREQVPFYGGLRGAELQRFEHKLKVFVYTKTFSSKKLTVTEEVKVVVAAAACRLTMNLPWEDYAQLRHVSVHADELEGNAGQRVVGRGGRSKVTVSWSDLVGGLAEPDDGDNVGYHEFAHALDAADGSFDGEAQGPPTEIYRVWRQVMTSARAEVRRALAASVDPPINAYAATDDAEFFAVATEWFFERPHDLRARLPAVYDLLCRFYRQDPAPDDAST